MDIEELKRRLKGEGAARTAGRVPMPGPMGRAGVRTSRFQTPPTLTPTTTPAATPDRRDIPFLPDWLNDAFAAVPPGGSDPSFLLLEHMARELYPPYVATTEALGTFATQLAAEGYGRQVASEALTEQLLRGTVGLDPSGPLPSAEESLTMMQESQERIPEIFDTFSTAYGMTEGSYSDKVNAANIATRALYPEIPKWQYVATEVITEELALGGLFGFGALAGLGAKGLTIAATKLSKLGSPVLQAMGQITKAAGVPLKVLEFTGKGPILFQNWLGEKGIQLAGIGGRGAARFLTGTPDPFVGGADIPRVTFGDPSDIAPSPAARVPVPTTPRDRGLTVEEMSGLPQPEPRPVGVTPYEAAGGTPRVPTAAVPDAAAGAARVTDKLYHGTRSPNPESFIDENGNLVLRASENFESKQVGVSFSGSQDTALDYASRIPGEGPIRSRAQGAVFEIDADAIPPNRLFREAADEIATRGTDPIIIPQGKYRIIKDVAARTELEQWEAVQIARVARLPNEELGRNEIARIIEREIAEGRGDDPLLGGALGRAEPGLSSDIVAKYGSEMPDNFPVRAEIMERISRSSNPEQTISEIADDIPRNPIYSPEEFANQIRKEAAAATTTPRPAAAPPTAAAPDAPRVYTGPQPVGEPNIDRIAFQERMRAESEATRASWDRYAQDKPFAAGFMKPVATGKEALLSRIGLEVRMGRLDEDTADAGRQWIETLSDEYLDNLASSYLKVIPDSRPGYQTVGRYIPSTDPESPALINILRGVVDDVPNSDRVIIHEVSHHLEQFIPAEDARRLVGQWQREMETKGKRLIDEVNQIRSEIRTGKQYTGWVGGRELTLEEAEKVFRVYRYEGGFAEWLAEVITDKALRDMYMEVPAYRNIIERVMAAIKRMATSTRDFLSRRGHPDHAERVYKNLVEGNYSAADRRNLYYDDAVPTEGLPLRLPSVLKTGLGKVVSDLTYQRTPDMKGPPPKPPGDSKPPTGGIFNRVDRSLSSAADRDRIRALKEQVWDRQAGLYDMVKRVELATGRSFDALQDTGIARGKQTRDLRTAQRTNPGASSAAAEILRVYYRNMEEVAGGVAAQDIDLRLVLNRIKEVFVMDGMDAKRYNFKVQGELKSFDSIAAVDAELAKLEARLSPDEMKKVQAGADETLRLFRAERKRLFDNGLLSKEEYDLWELHQPNYTPFRFEQDKISKPKAAPGSTKRKKYGSGSEVLDRGVYALTKEVTEESLLPISAVIPDQVTMNAVRISHNNVIDTALRTAAQDETMTIVRKVKGRKPSALEGTVAVWRDGVKEEYITPAWFKDELNWVVQSQFDNKVAQLAYNVGARPTDYTRRALTGANPTFWGPALVIDTLTAWLGRGVSPVDVLISPLLRKAVAILRSHSLRMGDSSDDLVIKIMRLTGGEQARFGGRGARLEAELAERLQRGGPIPSEVRSATEKYVRDNHGAPIFTDKNWAQRLVTVGNHLLAPIRKGFHALEVVGETLEQTPRRAFFRGQLDKHVPGWRKMSPEELAGKPITQQAAGEAIELTINFNRGARVTKILNPFTMFLNAGAEGFKIPLRQLVTNPRYKRGAWARLGVFSSGVAGLAYYNVGYPEYFDIPEDIRWGSLIVMLPSTKVDPVTGRAEPNYIAVIPRLREWALFFGPINALMESLAKDDPESFAALAKNSGEILTSGFTEASPVSGKGTLGDPMSLAVGFSPPLVGELIEQITNKDFYFDQEILSPELQALPTGEQVDPYTKRPSEWVAKIGVVPGVPDISPARVQHGVMGVGGGPGRLSFTIADWVADVLAPDTDPRIIKLVARYEGLNVTQRRALLNSLPPEERAKLEFALRKPEGVDVQPGDLPGAILKETFGRRFYPGRAGGLRESGFKAAEEATGFSKEDFFSAAEETGRISSAMRDEIWALEQMVDVKGGIPKSEFKNELKKIKSTYAPQYAVVEDNNPNAPQFAEGGDEFFEVFYTVGGTEQDTRTMGEMLLTQLNSIDLEMERQTGGIADSPAFIKLFRDRDTFRDNLSPEQQAALDEAIRSTKTPLERELVDAQRKFIPYWNAGIEDFITSFGERTGTGRISEIREYVNSGSSKRAAMVKETTATGDAWFFRRVEEELRKSKRSGVIRRMRNRVLGEDPRLEPLLREWGYD